MNFSADFIDCRAEKMLTAIRIMTQFHRLVPGLNRNNEVCHILAGHLPLITTPLSQLPLEHRKKTMLNSKPQKWQIIAIVLIERGKGYRGDRERERERRSRCQMR